MEYKACFEPIRVEKKKDAEVTALRLLNESLLRATEDHLRAIEGYRREQKGARLLNDSLMRATQEYLLAAEALKAGFDPSQPRAPAGNSDGGQWTDAGGGGGSSSRPQLPVRRPPGPGMPDEPGLGHPLSPLDFIGGGGVLRALKPVAGELIGAAAAARNALRLRLSGIPKEILTDHGGIRVGERAFSNKEVQEAIRTAKETGNVTSKIGKYRTLQHVYKGSNGVTIHIETQGRNAGKIITIYRHWLEKSMTGLRKSIENILRLEDIEGLIESGAPDDEYDSEAKEITRALNLLEDEQFTEENIVSIIVYVWEKMFNLDEDDLQKRLPAFQKAAQKILLLKK